MNARDRENRWRDTALRGLAAGVLVLVGLAAVDGFDALRVTAFQLARNDTPRPLWNAFVYAGTYLAGAFGIAVMLCHRPPVRRAAAALVVALACVQLGIAAVNGTGYSHHETALLFTETAFLPDPPHFFADRFPLPVISLIAPGC